MNLAPKYPADSFEKLITTISTEFINLPLREIDRGIQRALELIGSYAGVDRSYILRNSPDGSKLTMIHEWRSQGIPSAKDFYSKYPTSHFLTLSEQSNHNGIIAFSKLSELPDSANGLKATLLERGVSSFVAVPLRWHNHLFGFVGFATLKREKGWKEEDIALLELAAQMFVNALQRKRTERALRESDIRYRTLVESLGEGLLFCDPEDTVIHINRRFSEMTGFSHEEMYGKSVFDFFVPTTESDYFRTKTQRRLEGITESYTIELKRKSGEHFWAEITASPIRNDDGQIIGTLGAVTDITERRSTDEALRTSEEKYRTLLETSHDIIWSMDTKGCWTYINKAVEDILGYNTEDFLGQPFTASQSQYHAQKDLKVFQKILQGEKVTHYETEFLKNDGTPVILTVNAGPSYNNDGDITGITGTASDITDQYRAAEALRQQKEFLREVIDANPNLIFAKDKSGRFTLVNQALAEVYGEPVDHILGRTVEDFYEPEQALNFTLQDQAALRPGSDPVITEQRIRIPNSDTYRWYQIIKKPLLSPDGLPDQVLGVGIDLSNRKRSEEALKAIVEGTASSTAEDFFRSLVRHLALALNTRYAFLGIYTDTNKTQIRTLANWRLSQYTDDVTYDIAGTASEKVLDEGFYRIEKGALTEFPDSPLIQEDHIESFMGTAIRSPNGETRGVLVVLDTEPLEYWPSARYILNIFAERVSAEIVRMESERESIALQRQLIQAQKMEAIGQLAAGLAHDLNNALGAVVGHLQLIQLSQSLTTDTEKSLNVALNGCERATSLVEQLLGFSRQGKYQPEKIDLRSAIKESIDFLAHVVRDGVEVIFKDYSEPVYIQADSNQLQQALTNLILNANHAIEQKGSISFTLSTEQVQFPERLNPNATPGEYVTLTVQDSGSGIAADSLDKIFEPFFTTKENGEGTGLGLSMIYGMMQNHGGWITAHSELGHGSEFTLFFPVSTAHEPTKSNDRPEDKSERPLILVIDDEPFLVDLSVTFLARSNFRARGFHSSAEAVEWFRKHAKEVSLVILDMKMPHMDGLHCFEALQQIDPNVKVAILSGYIQDYSAQQVLERGALRFFQKPLRYPELIEWVRETVTRDDT